VLLFSFRLEGKKILYDSLFDNFEKGRRFIDNTTLNGKRFPFGGRQIVCVVNVLLFSFLLEGKNLT
jgi:hypothetical protein